MKNNRNLLIILIILIAAFIGAVIFIPQLTKKSDDPSFDVDLSKYTVSSYIEGNEDNGGIADHVKGADIKKAKLVIYEYADYQCSGCAMVNPWFKEILKEYSDNVSVVFRAYPLTSIHPSAIAAASAVEAAGLQGYWEEYGDLLFANQAEWFYATGNRRTEYFVGYFSSLTKGEGDVDKFKEDMGSVAVKAKVNFDRSIAESLGLTATPSFVDSDGKEIDWTGDQTKSGIQAFFRKYFDEKLGKK